MWFFTRQQAQPALAPAASPEEVMILRTNPLGQFPPAVGASEPISYYRHAMAPRIRTWVVFILGSAGIFAVVPEDEANILCAEAAQGQLQRRLHANETKVLQECVRDVLAAREAKYERAAWFDDNGGAA